MCELRLVLCGMRFVSDKASDLRCNTLTHIFNDDDVPKCLHIFIHSC